MQYNLLLISDNLMKKALFILLPAILIGFASCNKDGDIVAPSNSETTSASTTSTPSTTTTTTTSTTTTSTPSATKTLTTTTTPTTNTTPATITTTSSACNAQLSDVENMMLFPADNSWNQDISTAALNPNSSQIIAQISSTPLKADFGSGTWDGDPMGVPFTVVCGSQPKVKVTFRANANDGNYGSQSDPGPYAIPLNAPIEEQDVSGSDMHVISVDKDNGILYELYNASVVNGQWQASSGAIFNLNSDALRPLGWTSADAAGLPIFPGLVRYDEILAGVINHPIRYVMANSNIQAAYVFPARHFANTTGGALSLPFGSKIRLKASFDISGFSATNQVILTAMKKYGLILADDGVNGYFKGAPDSRWNNNDLKAFSAVTFADFEVVNYTASTTF
jgi:hypothetical protein